MGMFKDLITLPFKIVRDVAEEVVEAVEGDEE